jgi:hypothetical protein
MMKKTISILLFILLLGSNGFAQFIEEDYSKEVDVNRKIIVKTNLLAFFAGPVRLLSMGLPESGDYRLSLEFTTNRFSSLQISASYIGKGLLYIISDAIVDDSLKTSDLFTLNGFRVQLAYKIYPFSKWQAAPKGFFFGPHVSYIRAYYHFNQSAPKYADYSTTYANAALIWGYQLFFGERIALEIFSGLGYRSYWLRDEYSGEREKLNYIPEYTTIRGVVKLYLVINFGFSF